FTKSKLQNLAICKVMAKSAPSATMASSRIGPSDQSSFGDSDRCHSSPDILYPSTGNLSPDVRPATMLIGRAVGRSAFGFCPFWHSF
ncbi:MAG TPA: hypothetical protein VGK58_08095, partial [Lacipirellulaceae bacterium]